MTHSTLSRHPLVFVYGTLKEGFANFGVNRGQRVPGRFVTELALPMFIVGAQQVPWLVNRPGEGEPVRGELYRVDAAVLADMDRLEQIDEEGWYRREAIRVRALDAHGAAGTGPLIEAFVYFGDPARVARDTVHAGPLAEFLPEHDRRYRPDAT